MKINILHNKAMKQHSEWSYCQGTLIFSVPIPLWQLDGKREHDLRRQRTKKWACAKWPAGSWWLARMSTTTHPTSRNRNMATKSWAPEWFELDPRILRRIFVADTSLQCCQLCVSTACALHIPRQFATAAAQPGKDPCDTPGHLTLLHILRPCPRRKFIGNYPDLPNCLP